ncbi:hypothetical protein XENOCAPTIV_009670 [Xenoophorus captivus]|uniref:Uncharacterized protein n=1 Tax=Xenoophorus captivus TaxID=1517983 RepID=A0ABV0QV65_9TELE
MLISSASVFSRLILLTVSLSTCQAHMQSGIVPSHHPAPTHATMMLMATQGPPGGPQPPMPQTALNPIPVSSTTHFSYLTHPQGTFINLLTPTDSCLINNVRICLPAVLLHK